ncbi:hypothetical protein [Hamadaea tsunoensis]|uniref:hypothetical protein n=1 Tax=Hamadaea tsunoensis TaxID=53368 RepID=UPI000405F7C7|nr:hypothetical protein [Hamadaea tsunoensis]
MKRILLAAAFAVVAVLGSGVPAHATIGVPLHPWEWRRGFAGTCAIGAVTSAPPTVDGSTTISGWLQECPGVDTPSSSVYWAVVSYTTVDAHASSLASFPNRFQFSITKTLTGAGGSWANLTAFCVNGTPGNRVACFAVTPVGDHDASFAPIATDDPRVLVPYTPPTTIGTGGGGIPNDPRCFTCV